jgi:hypothetical protein
VTVDAPSALDRARRATSAGAAACGEGPRQKDEKREFAVLSRDRPHGAVLVLTFVLTMVESPTVGIMAGLAAVFALFPPDGGGGGRLRRLLN